MMVRQPPMKLYFYILVVASLLLFPAKSTFAKAEVLAGKVSDISGGCYYEVTITAGIGDADKTNLQALAACYFTYTAQGKSIRADEGLITGFVPANPNVGYEYLFVDRAKLTGDVAVWFFQVRSPSRADKLALEIKEWKNLSVLSVRDVRIREMSRLPEVVGKGCPIKKRFCVTGQENTLICSGVVHNFEANSLPCQISNITVTIESWMTGAKRVFEKRIVDVNDLNGRFNERIRLQPGTCGGEITLETNGAVASAKLEELVVSPCFQSVTFGPGAQMGPVAGNWSLRVRSGDLVQVNGVVRGSSKKKDIAPKAAIVTVSFRDAKGNTLPCKGLATSKLYGQYFYAASSDEGECFGRDLVSPLGAESIQLAVRAFDTKETLDLLEFSARVKVGKPWNLMCREFKGKVPSDAMLSRPDIVHRTLVEWLGSEEELNRLRTRKDTPAVCLMNYSLVLGKDWRPDKDTSLLQLRDFPGTTISPQITWLEDPFNSKTWQLKFSTGIWIPFLCANSSFEQYYSQCKAYWMSFFKNNTYPNRYSTKIYDDHVASGRIEALLLTMYGTPHGNGIACELKSMQGLLSEDPQFFEQMLYQLYTDVELIDYYLRHGRYGLHNHNLIMAKALLAFASCFPEYEFSKWYRDTAMDIVASHLRGMYESDGVIREQSALYHHTFTKTFLKIFSEMFQSLSPDFREEMLESLRKMVLADALLCPPDGFVLPIGDTGRNELRNELREAVAEVTADTGASFGDYPDAFEMCPSNSVFRESGLYIFRNPQARRMVVIDISDVLKVHGHYDLGNWLYYSDGNWWTTDLGGPWRYGTKEYRQYLKSESHNVFQPEDRGQALGAAYDVTLEEHSGNYVLSCKTNVYGPDCDTILRWYILKDLSAVAAQAICTGDGRFCGKLHLGDGVLADRISDSDKLAQWELSKGNETAFLACCSEAMLDVAMSAPRGIEQRPVQRLSCRAEAKDGSACFVVALGNSSNAVNYVIGRLQGEHQR